MKRVYGRFISVKQQTAEWQRERRIITASKAAALVGVHPWMGRNEALEEILHKTKGWGKQKPMNDFAKRATEYGIYHEKHAVEAFTKATGIRVEEGGLWIDPTDESKSASPDGVEWSKKKNIPLTVLEVKCPYTWGKHWDQEIPPDYHMPQVQLQMQAVGVHTAYFVAWSEERLRVWEIGRSRKYLEWLNRSLEEVKTQVRESLQQEKFIKFKRFSRKPVNPVDLIQTKLLIDEKFEVEKNLQKDRAWELF